MSPRFTMVSATLLALFLAPALTGPARAQGGDGQAAPCYSRCVAGAPASPLPTLRRRWVPPKPAHVALGSDNVAGIFVVKFVEGSHIRLDGNGFYFDEALRDRSPRLTSRLERAGLNGTWFGVDRVRLELAALKPLVARYAASHKFRASYGFRPTSMETFAAGGRVPVPLRGGVDAQFTERDELEMRSGEELADLDLYYVFHAPPGFRDAAAQERFMNELNRLRLVEQVYPLVMAGAPDISDLQTYLDSAPQGVAARPTAPPFPGSLGDGVRVADVEYDWITDHEDFPVSRFGGDRPLVCPYERRASGHGTAAMGIIAAPDNMIGIRGIAPNIQYVLSTVCRPLDYVWAAHVGTFSADNWVGRTHNVVVANAILAAAAYLRPGDVLLVEQHAPGPRSGIACTSACDEYEYVPMEYYPESFDAIRRAAARGIIVVEPAGNGRVALDGPAYFPRFDRSARDSGALLVGAANFDGFGNVPDLDTNRGARVDLYSWGSNVVTLGFGGGTVAPFNNTAPSQLYRNNWSGTSSAAAIVAGVVASVQGARLHAGGPALSARQMLDVLRISGTPQRNLTPGTPVPLGQAIGVQPNLAAALPLAVAAGGDFRGNGDYVIRSVSSGKVLDLDTSWFRGWNDFQPLIQFDAHGGDNQLFRMHWEPDPPAGFTIRPVHSLKCLQPAAATPLAPLVQMGCSGTAPQRFRIEAQGPYYRIVGVATGLPIEVFGASPDAGARIVQNLPLNPPVSRQLFEIRGQSTFGR